MGRTFEREFSHDSLFMYKLNMGLVPRVYDPFDDYGCIIQEEDKTVEELLFVMSGIVGTGYSRLGRYEERHGPFRISKKQEGM